MINAIPAAMLYDTLVEVIADDDDDEPLRAVHGTGVLRIGDILAEWYAGLRERIGATFVAEHGLQAASKSFGKRHPQRLDIAVPGYRDQRRPIVCDIVVIGEKALRVRAAMNDSIKIPAK